MQKEGAGRQGAGIELKKRSRGPEPISWRHDAEGVEYIVPKEQEIMSSDRKVARLPDQWGFLAALRSPGGWWDGGQCCCLR